MQWQLGNEFIVDPSCFHLLDKDLQKILSEPFVLTIDSYQLNINEEIVYLLKGTTPVGRGFRWSLSSRSIEEFLIPASSTMIRFALINNE